MAMTAKDLSRAVLIHLCADGTISYRTREQKVFNGRALPVFSVDTEEQAQQIQVRFGRLSISEHPLMPGKGWYKLSILGDGTDPVFRETGLIEIEDFDTIADMFRTFYEFFLAKAAA